MRRSVGVALAIIVASLTVVTAVYAAAGTSIATAPELPLGKQVSSSVNGLDFWRITVLAGDSLRIDYQPVATDWVALCLMAPEVTDATLGDAQCVEQHVAERKREYLRDFTMPGRYTLIIGRRSDACVNVYRNAVGTACSEPAAYELNASLVHQTSTVLSSVPKRVKRGSPVTVRGQVRGATGGKVALQQRVGAQWTSKGAVPLRAGRFTTKVRPATVGTYRYRIFYAGDSTHKPSSAGFSLTVT